MPVKKSRTVTTETPVSLAPTRSENAFYNVPSSPAANLALEFMSAGADLLEMPQRKQQINHSTKIQISGKGDKREITSIAPNHSITLSVADINKFIGSNKTAKKMFVLALIKINEQAVFDGKLSRDCVTFPLSELVENGFYKTMQSARKGFLAGMNALSDIKIGGEFLITAKDKISFVGLHPFRPSFIRNNQCYICLESLFDWKSLTCFFTILPQYYFKLSNRAGDLLYYIFYLARQRTKDIEQKGYFTISMRAIHNCLYLPDEKESKNPTRDIRAPIDEALEQIETLHSLYYNNTELSLLVVGDDITNISDFLNNGYLKVELKGAFASPFIDLSKKTKKRIEKNQQQQDKVKEKAQIGRILNSKK